MEKETALPVTIIRPVQSNFTVTFGELIKFKRFIYILFWRDVKVRYKQSVLGIAWVLIQPLVMTIVFSFVFGKMAKIPSSGVPYPVFTFTALLPWLMFQRNLIQGSGSLQAFKNEITKIYFPRIVAPLSVFASSLFDFFASIIILTVMMVYYEITPHWQIIFLPVLIFSTTLASLSFVLWLSALNVEYRDVGHVLPFLVQIWMFVTPVVYPSTIVPDSLKTIYFLNPMASVIEGFRWMMLGLPAPDFLSLAVSTAIVLSLGAGGLWYFNKVSLTMADRL